MLLNQNFLSTFVPRFKISYYNEQSLFKRATAQSPHVRQTN